MRLILSTLLLLFSYHSFGQDPSCELVITLKNVNVKKYSYRFFTDTAFNTSATNTIASHVKTGKIIGHEHTESALSKTQDGKSIITTYSSDYCYPNSQIKNQLRILIRRVHIKTGEIDFMFADCPLKNGKYNIFVEKFRKGQRDYELYETMERYSDSENVDYGGDQKRELTKVNIYIN